MQFITSFIDAAIIFCLIAPFAMLALDLLIDSGADELVDEVSDLVIDVAKTLTTPRKPQRPIQYFQLDDLEPNGTDDDFTPSLPAGVYRLGLFEQIALEIRAEQ